MKVVTLNLLNDLWLWSERRELVAANLVELEIDCAVAFNQPAAHNRKIYPSDHFGLAATLNVHDPTGVQ